MTAVLVAIVFVSPVLLMIWLDRRGRRVPGRWFTTFGAVLALWGCYSLVTRPGAMAALSVLQGIGFVVFGRQMGRVREK
jgi:uncharacterized membrane protein HdeD (DUF308 family)